MPTNQKDQRLLASFVSTGDPSTVNDAPATAFAPGQLGGFYSSDQSIPFPSAAVPTPSGAFPRIWQYVILDSAMVATPVAQQVVYWKDLTTFTVTGDLTATDRANLPAGILCNAATKGNYVFILVSGVSPVLCTAATPAANSVAVADATNDGQAAAVAAGTAPTHLPIGVFLAAKNTAFGAGSLFPAPGANFAQVLVNCPRIALL